MMTSYNADMHKELLVVIKGINLHCSNIKDDSYFYLDSHNDSDRVFPKRLD